MSVQDSLAQSLLAQTPLLNAIPQAVVVTDPEGVIRYWNRRAESLYGWSAGEVLGRSIEAVVPHLSAGKVLHAQEVLDAGRSWTGEVLLTRKDGTCFDAEISNTPILEPDGRRIGIIGVATDLTERKRSEQALRDSEARYSSQFRNNHSMMLVIDPDSGAIVDANPAACNYYGYSHAEFLRLSITDINILSPEQVKHEMHRARVEQHNYFEFRHRLANGSVRDVQVFSGPIILENRQMLYSIIQDVTEKKRAEAQVRHYAERLESLHQIEHAIRIADSPHVIAQSTVERLLEVIGCLRASVSIYDENAAHVRLLAAAGEGTTPGLFEIVYPASNLFTQRVYEGQIQALDDLHALSDLHPPLSGLAKIGVRLYVNLPLFVDGIVIGSLNLGWAHVGPPLPEDLAVAQEIADQLAIAVHHAQLYEQAHGYARALEQRVQERTRELQQSEARYRHLAENAQDIIYRVSMKPSFHFEYISPSVTAVGGYTPEDHYTDPQLWHEFVSPEEVIARCGAVANPESMRLPFRMRWVARDGSVVWTEHRCVPIFDEHGGLVAIEGIARDITHQQRLEDNLREALEKARELSVLKARFLSMVSHEFRVPLATIQSSSDLLRHYQHKMTEERRAAHFETISEQITHLTGLLDDVLEITRADTVGVQFSPLPVDVEQFCRELRDEVQRTLAGTREIEYSVTGADFNTAVDPRLLRQAVTNLLSNALKYSPPESAIRLELRSLDAAVQIRVIDQGIGIPREDQARLFDVFYRASNVGARAGTGLGLAIVKRAVEAHGGTVAVESALGVGTTVTLSFPLGGRA